MKSHNLFLAIILILSVIACKDEHDLDDGLYAEFNTDFGEFIAELNYDKAPLTVANFVALAEGNHPWADDKFKDQNYFDGLKFHRVVKGFVIQGGDPDGTGSGGPGYEFPNEVDSSLSHDSKGVLSMANAGPDTNGSQFFITLDPTPNLDGGYSVFGKIAMGQEVVDSIGTVKVGPQDVPEEDVVMNSVKIIRIGKEAKNFNAPVVFEEEIEKLEEKEKEAKEQMEKEMEELAEGYEKTESGLYYKITKENKDGKRPKPGQRVSTFYKGMLTDGKVFDQRQKDDPPLTFEVGVGMVIPGWDEGLTLMREGEEARLIIPSHLAYGPNGRGPIPPNSVLIFDVTLEKIED